jgi:hypothetical protein
MSGLVLAVPALLVSFAVAPINGDDYYPPRCFDSPEKTGQTDCIHYLLAQGAYEIPPARIPADITRIDPVLNPPRTAFEVAVEVAAFRFAGLAIAFTLAAAAALWIRSRGAPAAAPRPSP